MTGGVARRPWRGVVAAVVVVGLVAAGVTVLCVARLRPVARLSTCVLPNPAGPVDELAQHAPDGGALTVTETGFTQVDQGNALFGAVIRNTSAYAAYQTDMRVMAYDAEGRDAYRDSPATWLHLGVPVILPGEAFGLGAAATTRPIAGDREVIRVARFTVVIGETRWVRPDGLRRTGATVHEVDSKLRLRHGPAYCKPVPSHGYSMLLRDSSGRIIGGAYELDRSSWCRSNSDDPATWFGPNLPTDIDWSRSEVVALCDPISGASEWAGKRPFNYPH
jgi:hypothetical protein